MCPLPTRILTDTKIYLELWAIDNRFTTTVLWTIHTIYFEGGILISLL